MNKRKRLQRCDVFSLDYDEYVDLILPAKRNDGRKYYPMKVSHVSMREDDYIELSMAIEDAKSTYIDDDFDYEED